MSTALSDHLSALRRELKQLKLDGILIPVNDEFLSEYPPANTRRVEFLTGFSGSAGMAIVLENKAAIFVDGRYTLQAKTEVPAEYEQHNSGDTKPEQWLADTAPTARIGYDPLLFTHAALERIKRAAPKVELVATPENPLDTIWQNRPSAPNGSAIAHSVEYAGDESLAKRDRIAAELKKQQLHAVILTSPDSINWLLNIRGADLEHTPLALCRAILHENGRAELYLSKAKCAPGLQQHLSDEITVHEPETIGHALKTLGANKARVLLDSTTAPVWFRQQLEAAGAVIVDGEDPCILPKAIKNATELKGIRKAHLRDGVAVVKLLAWLETAHKTGVDELQVTEKLLQFRSEQPMFISPSFSTIAGSGPNGAIVHYRANETTNRKLSIGELFLLDSGGQYPDGTTDITRTIAIGEPNDEMRDRFTLVLKGHIALATASFPKGTSGSQLDALARQYLWQAGLDYDHGTGHGVGQSLNVHEGPQRISKRGGDAPLVPGMVISNEPGYYKTGAYGIRIENLVAVVEKREGEAGKPYYGFETLTCVPIDRRLIIENRLTKAECDWLNAYHGWVFAALSAKLDQTSKEWLEEACAPLCVDE